MLSTPAEFPHPGSDAFLAPTGEPVRIIQLDGANRALVGLRRTRANPAADRQASGSRTVPREHLFATVEDATALKQRSGSADKKPTKRRARK